MSQTRIWQCWLCEEDQETIDKPLSMLCGGCIGVVADALCWREMKLSRGTPGVDGDYWMRQASSVLVGLSKRLAIGHQRRSAAAQEATR